MQASTRQTRTSEMYSEPGDAATGDPAFILAVPVEQFRPDFVFLAPDKYAFDYVTITAPIGAEVFFDDLPVESFADWEPIETQLHGNRHAFKSPMGLILFKAMFH